MAWRSARAARRGSLRFGQVAHDDEVAGAAPGQVRDLLRRDAAGDEDRDRRLRRRRAEVVEPGAGTAGFGGRGLDRPGGDVGDTRPGRPGRATAARSAGAWVESPMMASGPRIRRASATGASSWPTWTPSAPTSRARSGRSLRMKGTPWSAQTRGRGGPARQWLAPRGACRAAGRRPPRRRCRRRGSARGRAGRACRGTDGVR